jgi:hypothetical protein
LVITLRCFNYLNILSIEAELSTAFWLFPQATLLRRWAGRTQRDLISAAAAGLGTSARANPTIETMGNYLPSFGLFYCLASCGFFPG